MPQMKEPTFSDLRSYLDFLREEDQLAVIDAPVDPNLEVAEIHRRVIAAGGPALLFTQVQGSDFPLVTNLFGDHLDRHGTLEAYAEAKRTILDFQEETFSQIPDVLKQRFTSWNVADVSFH